MNHTITKHYDLLIDEGNDPVLDPPMLRDYMDQWDGALFIDLLGLTSSKSVLEIGCGTGRLAVKIAPLVKAFCGIDLSPKTIETARTHLPYSHVELVCGDFLTHPFRRTFDVICSSLTFMHIEDKETAVKNVRSLLNPGGRFVLSMDKNRDEVLVCGDRTIKVFPDHPDTIVPLLEKNGFKGIKTCETELAYIVAANK